MEDELQYTVNSDTGHSAGHQFFEEARADALAQPKGSSVQVECSATLTVWKRTWDRKAKSHYLKRL